MRVRALQLLALLLLVAAPSAQAGFWADCQGLLTRAWSKVFPVDRVIEVGDRSFHVYADVLGQGGEGTVYRLFDMPGRKLKVFIPDPEAAFSGEGRIDLVRRMPLPQGYIEGWVRKLARLREAGLPVPEVYEVGRGFVVMELIDGVSYKKLGREELGYSKDEIESIRREYWKTLERAKARAGVTIDGADTFKNLLWDPKRRQWVIIDP